MQVMCMGTERTYPPHFIIFLFEERGREGGGEWEGRSRGGRMKGDEREVDDLEGV